MNDKSLPPEVLANALQDRVHPSSGVLKDQRPVRRYGSRKPGTNPRTGEPLVPWQEVQVLDPELPAWDYFLADVCIATDEGSRVQTFKVRAIPYRVGVVLTEADMMFLGRITAEGFGFTVVLS